MKKGIVMEVDDPYLTLLTSDGEFLRARKMDRLYSIGEEIDFFPVTGYLERNKTNLFKNFFTLRKVLMSMAVLMVSLGSLFPVYQSNKTYAYMSIDTNTSIEMGLNKNMEVVELKGFTKEAETIISQLEDWKKKDASELTAILVAELKDEGIIAQTEPVVISTVKTLQLKEKAAAKLQENVDKIKQTIDKHPVEVKMYTTTEAEVEKARNSGVPVGIYHSGKNNSAQNKQKKEKIKQIKNNPTKSSGNSTLPPGQLKKQAEINSSPNADNRQQEIRSNNNNAVEKQTNGKQASPDTRKGINTIGSEEWKPHQEKQIENNTANKQIKQDKPKTNNHNKLKKQENNGKK
ncbi:anti-sigma factor domain-containing protein [Neobacillus niacini]|uniref:anti-sigma factor domain-containing protein n=1 Tax=Neobacillus niacini TaxID=86668 RepID=UPI00204233CA|nr:anti-sigma factor domain-containing protein [Neobacillus niacini]MCM3690104.1 anti-sigma factor domain-containing protein [Neobacillus niacini]